MAEGRDLLRLVRLFQDESGRITGGMVLYPPNEEGKKLNAKEAKTVYDCESMDGFEVWQRNNISMSLHFLAMLPIKKLKPEKARRPILARFFKNFIPSWNMLLKWACGRLLFMNSQLRCKDALNGE